MILAIVGSRDFKIPYAIMYADRIIRYYLDKCKPDEVVSGGAVGVDTLAINRADLLGYRVKEFLPEVKEWNDCDGKTGFKSRNETIGVYCDELLCITCAFSDTYGSGYTRDFTKSLGKVTYSHVL